MDVLYLPAAVMLAGAGGAWLFRRFPQVATAIGAGTVCGGAGAGIILLMMQMTRSASGEWRYLFILPVLLLASTAGMHAVGYLAGHGSERSGTFWSFFNLTVVSMLAVVMASTPVQFLIAWELMGLCSFVLVLFDRHNAASGRAGWIYMMACHAGAAFLILLFFFPHTPVWMLVLALLGFGLKIGFPLLHVWLPEAHPAAPAPVSALMSGAMIELGFYGLLIFGTVVPEESALYGRVLAGIGIITAPAAIIFALAQSNLKKLLAYSSIENMGILSCALGLGFLGKATGNISMMICGFAGAGVHLCNHALLKGALFLGSGSVYKACGTLDMDRMGGLLKRMPRTGSFFIINALSLCGLPPFAGFAGEFIIYMAAFCGLQSPEPAVVTLCIAVLISLALTGGLAAAAMSKAIGSVFCGEPRSAAAAEAVEVHAGMNLPVLLLTALSIAVLFLIPEGIGFFFGGEYAQHVEELSGTVSMVCMISFVISVLTMLLWFIRSLLVRRTGERISPTWDCGYSVPDARMEYTATSFSQNQVAFFRWILKPLTGISRPQGIFPKKAEFDESVPDGGIEYFWSRIFKGIGKTADRIHALQSGSLHFYLLVVVLTMAVMLVCAVYGGK